MSIKVTGTWDNTEDYTTYYAQTDDPRVLAVIVRDDDATFERCLDGEPIDLDDWEIQMSCWGYVGEEYAKESAARWEAGAPELHTMLPID